MRSKRQLRIISWVRATFGEAALGLEERTMRFIEEAAELAQACGLSQEAVLRIVHHVYGRPVGEPAQEAGGVGCTLLALCEVLGIDADELEDNELRRVVEKPKSHFQARQNAKADAGVGMRVEEKE